MKHNLHAEQAVIGDILLDAPAVLPEALLELAPEDFENAALREIFSTCRELYMGGKPVDAVTVLNAVGPGYREIVLAAAESVPSVKNYSAYIRIVRNAAKLRAAAAAAESLLDDLQENDDVEHCRENAAEILRALDDRTADDAVSAKEGLLNFLDSLDKPRTYITTGFGRVDKYLFIEPGDYIVIGGRPSSGKTAFTLQMMLHMAARWPTAYFSLETRPDKLFDRIVACHNRVNLGDIKRRSVPDADLSKITAGSDDFFRLKCHVVPAAGWTVEQIRAKTVQLGAKVIFVDYIGLVRGDARTNYERVTQISMQLHTLAQQLGVVVIALSQLSRSDDLGMASLRDSGQIEQDADAILLLDRAKDTEQIDNGKRTLVIAKNKEGRLGRIEFNLDGARQRFYQLETGKE